MVMKSSTVALAVTVVIGLAVGYGIALTQILSTQDNMRKLQETNSSQKQDYTMLQDRYDNLRYYCYGLTAPVLGSATIGDLNIVITVYRGLYYYKEAVSGNVSITYTNRTLFKGEFSLYVSNNRGLSKSEYLTLPVNGYTEFCLSSQSPTSTSVFQYGPGNYTIGVYRIISPDGRFLVGPYGSANVEVKAVKDLTEILP